MNFVSSENKKQNLVILPLQTKKKKRLRSKPSKKYVLLPPRMLNLPKSNQQPTMIHYHFLSGFGRPSALNEAPQPLFHRGDTRPPSPEPDIGDIYTSSEENFEYFFSPLGKVKKEENI